MKKPEKVKVSLDNYRSEGVSVFSGRGRGTAVARAIKEKYGAHVEIKIPEDVIIIDRNFRSGFQKILPNVSIPKSY